MKYTGLLLFLLPVLLFSGCQKKEISFPREEEYYEIVHKDFQRLWKITEPEAFHAVSEDILQNLAAWERSIEERQIVLETQLNENVLKDWDRLKRHSYQMVVDQHVQAYIYKKELQKPRYYAVQGKIAADLDLLILQINRFMILNYPIRDLDMAFYKNLPDITSRTSDPEGNMYFIIKVNVGYIRTEKQTQTAVNSSKQAMIDIVRSYCSQHTENELMGWNEVNLKAGLMKELNDYLVQFYDFKPGKLEGVKAIAISKIQTFPFN